MAFRFDKLTVKAQEAVQRAQQVAEDHGHPQLLPLHLLKALADEEDGIVKPLLQKIGVNLSQLSSMVDSEMGRLPKVSGTGTQLAASPAILQVFEAAQKRADLMKDAYVSTEHLLLALTEVDDTAKRLLELNGVEEQDVLHALQSIRGGQQV
ncbi:MAG TPA: ATP-dependent chaperone ClpB, partial [Planctomycetaceae bacterium]|nr:ATP-dependent chaperone ClpB [Planctomycetaceae bacterium]